MRGAAFLHHHCHDGVFICLSALLVYPNDLVYLHVAHEIAHNEYKVGSDDAMCVNVAHCIAWRESLLRGDNWNNLDPR